MSDINKGGVGSGVKGHHTDKKFIDNRRKEVSKLEVDLGNEKYYHLSNEEEVKFDDDFQNEGQEFGSGLYITSRSNLDTWDIMLGGREHAIEVNTKKLKVIKEEDIPSMSVMAKDFKAVGIGADDIQAKQPTGWTMGKKPFTIALKREWAKLMGFSGIITKEGRDKESQLVVLDSSKVSMVKTVDVFDLRTNKMLDVGNWEYTLKIEKIKGNDGRRIIAGWASDEFVDGDGEIMDLASLKAVENGYMRNPVIRFMHNQSDLFRGAIGKVIPSYTDSGGVVHKTTFDKRPYLVIEISKSKSVDEIWKMIDEGLYTGLSIGGKASKKVKEWSSKLGKTVNRIFMRSWHETSVVDTPAASTGFFSVIKSQCSGLECACPLTTHNKPILYSERVNKFLQSDMGYIEKGGVGSGVKGHRTDREKVLDEALKEHKKFKAKVKDKDADIAYEKLFGDSGYVVKINAELKRQVAVATRFGTPEEKKKKESVLRHKLSPDFPFNMLKGKKEKKEFQKYRDIYKLHLVDSKNELDIQLKIWGAFESTLKKEDIKKINKMLDEILGAEDVTKKKVWIKDRSKAPKELKLLREKKVDFTLKQVKGVV